MIICLGEALFPKGDLEQLQQDFTKYAANFKKFFIATVADGVHTEEKHVAHGGRKKTKATLQHIGGDEIKTLFDHVVMVVDGDTFDDALSKEADGIPQQTNQATINPLWGDGIFWQSGRLRSTSRQIDMYGHIKASFWWLYC